MLLVGGWHTGSTQHAIKLAQTCCACQCHRHVLAGMTGSIAIENVGAAKYKRCGTTAHTQFACHAAVLLAMLDALATPLRRQHTLLAVIIV